MGEIIFASDGFDNRRRIKEKTEELPQKRNEFSPPKDFLQSKIIHELSPDELEIKLNQWLALGRYANVKFINYYILPLGGGEKRNEPTFTAIILYVPLKDQMKSIYNDAVYLGELVINMQKQAI